jgi:hypothetical protein
MKKYQLQWMTYLILLLVILAISLFFGVNYPLPPQPEEPPEPIELGAHFANPIDITGSSSASAPALTFEGDTDTGIFRSAANTLNITSGGTEMLEVDSSGFTVSSGTALDVDGGATIDGGTLDVNDAVDVDGSSDEVQLAVTGYTTQTSDMIQIDGGLTDIGGGTYGVADGDNDLGVAGTLEVHGQARLEGNVDLNDQLDLDGDSDEVQLSVNGYTTQTNDLVQLDGGLTDIGGGTYGTADGDNDLGVEGDLEANGALDVGGTTAFGDDVTLANDKTIYGSTSVTGTHGVMMLCYGSHSHSDVENVVKICDIPANANVIDYAYHVTTDWNDGTEATVNCGYDGGDATDVNALIAADSINGIGDDTLLRMGADAEHPASTTVGDIGTTDAYVRCQVAESDNDASAGSATLYIWYQID